MENAKSTLAKGILDTITKVLPADLKILHISLCGSRGKKLDGPDSDYDVKVIVINTTENAPAMEKKILIKTSYEGKNLEGEALSLEKALNLAIETHPFMMELLRGENIYSEPEEVREFLIEVYRSCFNPVMPLKSLSGHLHKYLTKELKNELGEYNERAKAKTVVEAVYLTLLLRCLLEGKDIMDYITIDELMIFAGKEEKVFKELVEIRKADKNKLVELTPELIGSLETISKQSHKKFRKAEQDKLSPEVIKKRDEMRKKADKFFSNILNKEEK